MGGGDDGIMRAMVLPLRSATGFGGMESHADNIEPELRHRGWEISRVAWSDDPGQRDSIIDRGLFDRPDVILAHSWHWFDQFSAMDRTKAPLIVRSAGNEASHVYADAVSADRLTQWASSSQNIDVIVANSQYTRNTLIELGFGPDRIQIVRGGFQVPEAAPDAWPDGHPRILISSRLVPFKRIDHAIEVVSILARTGTFELVVMGDGPLRENLEVQARKSKAMVTFLGRCSAREVGNVMNSCSVLLSTSESRVERVGRISYVHTETMGRSLCEAQGAGRRVVATRVGGVPEIVAPSLGLTVAPDDLEALADAVSDQLRLGEPAESDVLDFRAAFGWNAVGAKFDRIMHHTLNKV